MNHNNNDFRLKIQLRIVSGEVIALGPGKVELLEAIRDKGSISAAGRAMSMSYRRAWDLVATMNRSFKQALVITETGGAHGGGAHLTPFGQEVVARFRAMETRAHAALSEDFAMIQSMLERSPKID